MTDSPCELLYAIFGRNMGPVIRRIPTWNHDGICTGDRDRNLR